MEENFHSQPILFLFTLRDDLEFLFYSKKKRLKSCLTQFIFSRSPGKITSVSVPTFEALTQFGVAKITTKNTGEVEASYSLTVLCFSIYIVLQPYLYYGQSNVDFFFIYLFNDSFVFFIYLMTDMHYFNFYTHGTVLQILKVLVEFYSISLFIICDRKLGCDQFFTNSSDLHSLFITYHYEDTIV